ncbi:hypothetical protein ABZ646_24155 [Streptomyces sp. NPDC007162]|uniref:hypothetical protein n=1 Tax=Streptomyces sp. NPDC007162 TaxID=3156917 RepID=UPI0033D34DD3
MDLNEHHRGAPEPEQPVDRSPAQPHGGGRPDAGSAVVALAGEFGAELVRAIRVGLAEVGNSGHGARGPSQLSWYAFAAEYARAHWPGRAAKTRDEVRDALTAVTMAMLGTFLAGRTGSCCVVPCGTGRSSRSDRDRGRCRHKHAQFLLPSLQGRS